MKNQSSATKIKMNYTAVYGRENHLSSLFLGFFFMISSYPRLVMEVFLRRSLGERYFNLGSCLTVAFLLFVTPFTFFPGHDASHTFTKHITWFIFLAAFLVFSFIRWQEVRREPGVFDFAKYGLSTGLWLPFLNRLTLFGKPLTSRQIITFAEPLIFLVAGLLLLLLQQLLGLLLIFCAVIYCLSYLGAFKRADDDIRRRIDKEIINEQFHNSFVLQKNPEETKGFYFMGKGPASYQQREDLANSFLADDDEEAAGVN